MAIMVLMGLEFLIYCSWLWFVIAMPSLHQHVNMLLLNQLLPYSFWLILATALFMLVLTSIEKTNKRALFNFQLVLMLTYSAIIGYLAYLPSQSSLASGIAISTTPVLALLLMERRIAFFAFFINFFILFFLIFLENKSFLPHSPLYPQHTFVVTPFWIMSFFHFVVSKVFLVFFSMDIMLNSMYRHDKKIAYLSDYDALTSVLNRRAFMRRACDYFAQQYLTLPKEKQRHGSIIMVDIDFFKQINEKHGHLVGDKVLQKVATLLAENIRASDYIGRFGGEEFIILLTDCMQDQALFIAENLRQKLYNIGVLDDNKEKVTITASFGVVSSADISLTLDNTLENPSLEDSILENNRHEAISHLPAEDFLHILLEYADDALYASKNSGKNQVYSANAFIQEKAMQNELTSPNFGAII